MCQVLVLATAVDCYGSLSCRVISILNEFGSFLFSLAIVIIIVVVYSNDNGFFLSLFLLLSLTSIGLLVLL
jgi:hypothetical protein